MNFIAGFFLYLTNNSESLALACFRAVISKFGLENIFVDNLPLLFEMFYKLRRLTSRHHPDLAEWLDEVGINPNYYASPWLMTIFTASLNGMKGEPTPEMLLAIWDAFLLYGWKGVFKASLYAIRKLCPSLEMDFDHTLLAFSSVMKDQILADAGMAVEFKREFYRTKITNKDLDALGEEYGKIRLESGQQ